MILEYGKTQLNSFAGVDAVSLWLRSSNSLAMAANALPNESSAGTEGLSAKGTIELESGMSIPDQYSNCGRKRAEYHLPNLFSDIKSIVDPHSQADPTFRSKRIFSPLTVGDISRRLQAEKGSRSSDLPTVRTIQNKLNDLEIRPQRVKKCEPIRKVPETDAIFKQVKTINAKTDNAPNAIRISLDCKAVVKIGPFSRGGKNRIEQKASDHDFESKQKLVPFGIFLPEFCESHFWFSVGLLRPTFGPTDFKSFGQVSINGFQLSISWS